MNPVEQLVDALSTAGLWQKTMTLQRHQLLVVHGSRDSHLYHIQKGTLRIFVREGEEEHTIRFGYPGNLIAALDTFITGQPTEYYIQALKGATLRGVSKTAFLTLMRSNPDLQDLWNSMMQGLVLQQLERERDLLTSSPVDRYHRVLERSPQLFQEVPDKYIANYLRMTPETLSRIKKS